MSDLYQIYLELYVPVSSREKTLLDHRAISLGDAYGYESLIYQAQLALL